MAAFHRFAPAALAAAVLVAGLAPGSAHACACGCGVFGVGTSSLLPSGSGWRAWVENDHLNQDHNRHGTHGAPAEDNEDRRIEFNFLTLSAQFMSEKGWGVSVEVPLLSRTIVSAGGHDHGDDEEEHEEEDEFSTLHHADEDEEHHADALTKLRHSGLGDIRIVGTYAGFSPDMSTGVSVGVKLPTGGFHTEGFERDTDIGTGSTDLLLGAYHRGPLNKAQTFGYFVQAAWDRPIAYQDGYKPGQEINVAAGAAYSGWTIGPVKIAPMLQVVASHRDSDTGREAAPDDSGYDRVLVSPGVELSAGKWRLYGDFELPVYSRYRGDQLAAQVMSKVILSRSF